MIATSKNHYTQLRILSNLIGQTLRVYDEEAAKFTKDPFGCKKNLINIQVCTESLTNTRFLPIKALKSHYSKIIRALKNHDKHAIHDSREMLENSFIEAGYLKPITAYPRELETSPVKR